MSETSHVLSSKDVCRSDTEAPLLFAGVSPEAFR